MKASTLKKQLGLNAWAGMNTGMPMQVQMSVR